VHEAGLVVPRPRCALGAGDQLGQLVDGAAHEPARKRIPARGEPYEVGWVRNAKPYCSNITLTVIERRYVR
jgi:hypothetical protein